MTLDTKVQLAPAGAEMVIPKLYISGFPKSGLHLANRMAMGMFKQHNAKHNWLGTNAWTVERYNLDIIHKYFLRIQPGEYIKGHIGWLPSIETVLILLGMGVVFVYRDLRDVVVSQMYHLLDDQIGPDGVKPKLPHPNKQIYQDLETKEKVMLAVIEGLDEYPGVFDRFDTFAGWMNSEWAMSISYEVMRKNPYLAANKFFNYIFDIALMCSDMEGFLDNRSKLRENVVNGIMMEMAHNPTVSPTYRKGTTGDWRNEFTPAVIDCFKDNDPGWLVELGYERDDTWQ